MKHTIAALILLHQKSRTLAVSNPPPCANGLEPIKCVDGKEVGSDTSCKDACTDAGGTCCVDRGGRDACEGFNGSVCPDGSCSGDYACDSANIDIVVDGCVGPNACRDAGGAGGYIGMIVNSCKSGNSNCNSTARYGGSINSIVDSCQQGSKNCESAARSGGYIKYIDYSCGGVGSYFPRESCYRAGANGGTISGINGSCNSYGACTFAGNQSDIEPAMVECCNAVDECAGIKETPDSCIKADKSAKSSKATKARKVGKSSKLANEIIKGGLKFQGIEFSMMAGDETLSNDQSVDVGLLSFKFSDKDEFEYDDIDEDEDEVAFRESPFHKRKD